MADAMKQLHLLVFPFPAQGHMLPLLDFAHQLATRGFAITILVTPRNLPHLQHLLSISPSIQPLVLPFPDDTPIPDGIENASDLPTEVSMANFMLSLVSLRPFILKWARSQAFRPAAIISDFFLGWTNDLASDLGIPRIVFFSSGAFMVSVTNYLWHNTPEIDLDGEITLHSLPGSPKFRCSKLSPFYLRYRASDGAPEWEFVRESMLANSASWGAVINTFDALEGPFIDHLRASYGHDRVWTVGPIVPAAPTESRGGKSSVSPHDLASFLDSCPVKSVVYVCFGSLFKSKPDHSAVIARALERSGTRFVWAAGADSQIPEGFEKKTEGRGMVIRGWAPQLMILGHAAVGSFLTHCGWNSVLEGVTAGKVMLTWPLGADQFLDARLLVEYAGTGVEACAGGRELPDAEELGRVLSESVDVEKWPEIRARAAEMSSKAKEAIKEGGSSFRDVGRMVNEVGQVKGMLIATVLDGNSRVFPVAFTIADKESSDTLVFKLHFHFPQK